jgi:hypothetical protein
MDAITGVGTAKAVSTNAIGLPARRVILLPVPLRGERGWNARVAAWAVAA